MVGIQFTVGVIGGLTGSLSVPAAQVISLSSSLTQPGVASTVSRST